ncbi:LytTR family DNA-binding domain-containing protein [Aquimarina sp. 2201CG5-10]|uniref:LytR/AlgR family response regulator transcription factor n=1 Tax=Aquimarina callyspongiae TaxID=3098150 RepID=UPI002AB3F1B0|nr:LytTR family DNA-binding domain-containing protein [Aquimarina sp. 2201CG5-10]MDY8138754.1 LytTR family DNA-binding domain-containing protein [Aquimarina sp. 2201CG5-10]
MELEAILLNKEVSYIDSLQKELQTLNHTLKKLQPKLSKICLSTTEGFEFINLRDIVYCKANGSYTSFILKDKTSLLVSKHLKEYENMLINQHFMRIHNSFLINLREVRKFMKSDGGYIIMNNNHPISISKQKKKRFLNAMNNL